MHCITNYSGRGETDKKRPHTTTVMRGLIIILARIDTIYKSVLMRYTARIYIPIGTHLKFLEL